MNFIAFKEKLITFIYPKRCIFCNEVIPNKLTACEKCSPQLPVDYIECYARGPYRCVSSFPYSGVYREALLNMKFNSRPNYGRQMAVYIAQDIKRYYNDVEFNMITSVPLYRAQLFDRGYNQSRILAREIGRILSLPYEDVLIKYRNNKRQYTLKAKERAKNVARVYKVADKSLIKDKNILIIDDVITTGCTLGACSKVLFKGGANLVCTATFCCTEIK